MKLTIFTPTFNRGNLLYRIYDSLKTQAIYNFEWLIIDDGSTDNTEEIVQKFLLNKTFPVRYYKKENGGKHTAHNFAVSVAKGEYFMCLDSDDRLSENAMTDLMDCIELCDKNEGIIAYKVDEEGNLLSDIYPKDLIKTNTIELTLRFHCSGEFTLLYPTDVLKENTFPVFQGERFISENVIYDVLSDICNMRLLNSAITLCEYQDDGYTSNFSRIMKSSPAGFALYFMQRIDLQKNLAERLNMAAKYLSMKHFAGNNKSDVRLKYKGSYKYSVLIAYPLSIAYSLYYKFVRHM